jgi:hypothetical protein
MGAAKEASTLTNPATVAQVSFAKASDFAGRFGFMVEAGLRFFSRAAALRLTFRPPWV